MTFISYAQNAEDVVLHRFFRDDPPGVYIDVGAFHPVMHSLTKSLYDRGWHGINVEPASWGFEALSLERTRDVNLNVGVSSAAGHRTFYEGPPANGLSTFTAAHVPHHRAAGHPLRERTVEVVTLASLCEAHLKGGGVDLLAVDVEGHERDVLAGADFQRFRPRLVVVESVDPVTHAPSHMGWEELLTGAGYHFALFDGLNRWYVRREDEARLSRLAPANFLDDHVRHESMMLAREAAVAKALLEARDREEGLRRTIRALRAREQAFDDEKAVLEARYERLERSVVASRARCETIERSWIDVRTQCETVTPLLEASRAHQVALLEELRRRQAELDELRWRFAEMEAAEIRARGQVSALRLRLAPFDVLPSRAYDLGHALARALARAAEFVPKSSQFLETAFRLRGR